jgi:NADPH:quinone reductase-like Zn-dependent oxidoreductase
LKEGPLLVAREPEQPRAGRGEVLIRVCAAGVTPTELLWYPTTHTKSGTARWIAVTGHEFSGVIEAVGKEAGDCGGVSGFGRVRVHGRERVADRRRDEQSLRLQTT